MHDNNLLNHKAYDPNGFIGWLIEALRVKNDAALARRLETSPVTISKIRHSKLVPPATLLISIHEETGLSIREIRERMFRQSDPVPTC